MREIWGKRSDALSCVKFLAVLGKRKEIEVHRIYCNTGLSPREFKTCRHEFFWRRSFLCNPVEFRLLENSFAQSNLETLGLTFDQPPFRSFPDRAQIVSSIGFNVYTLRMTECGLANILFEVYPGGLQVFAAVFVYTGGSIKLRRRSNWIKQAVQPPQEYPS
ncbi:hypothetical protein K0M31_015410 [Melipona bicolor]|uniref:Uncharacterized protein n=1 Tax=Melipona bicolor TaxID=60889 RepID=A0AA40FFQ5_9HYME|nr:hypothetical protein K0M31_015410 [Melipona bicolor]